MRPSILAALTFGLGIPLAHAQPADLPAEPPPPPPPDVAPGGAPVYVPPPAPVVPVAPPAAESTVDKGVIEDANSGRSWLMPTALTEPAGTWSFSDFELLMISGSYAFTDQFTLSFSTVLPIFKDMPFIGILNAKYQVLKSGNFRLALQGSATHVRESGESVTVGNLGGALTLCIDSDCHSHLSGYIGAGFAQENESSVPFLVAGSLAFRVSKRVKVLLEVDSAFIAGEINESANGFLGWYGVRFTSKEIGVDLGLARPFGELSDDELNEELPFGLPFVSFTYRAYKD